MILLYPLKIIGFEDLFYRTEGLIQYGMLRMIAMWSQWAGYEVLETGDDITECLEERTLVLVNHQSAGDIPILLNAFIDRIQILPNVMWIMDNHLKYSTFGIVCAIHRDFFIFQGKEFREKSLEALSKHLTESYIPLKRKWLVIFPEGGFLYKRRERSQKYGQKNNLPHLEHVTIPRVGALQVVMNELKTKTATLDNNSTGTHPSHHLKYILDVTIGYPRGEPLGILDLIFGNLAPSKTTLYYRLFPISQVPQGNEALSKWIIDRWAEKENLLDTFYKTGSFPNSNPPRVVRQNLLQYLGIHVAFLASTYFHYQMLTQIYQYFCSNFPS
ncbi:hypothetical protein HHI36_010827 [Cryptolaemus montrouzieri]|uniref:Phospholipid/glycerol acyltransferase domain-containing protein n=1 Tax=Cryptolaemus montrouzieri TaxID=559131 RepID=A0ABD2MK35_9CUCU